MWARIAEIFIGGWLFVSPFIFCIPIFNDWIAAFFICLIASLSYIRKISKIHLLQVLPATWLLYLGYSYPTSDLPFYLQNYILSALALITFTVIPCYALDPPNPWKKFLKDHPDL